MPDENYIQNLIDERDILDTSEFSHTIRLLENEIDRVRTHGDLLTSDLPVKSKFKEEVVKLTEKVVVPVEEYPKFNFVGKLLGPKGNTLKRLQANTKTKISILGRGSTRNKDKEEELSQSNDTKYEHLNEPLHVLIEVEAVKSEAHQRLGRALAEVYKCLVPENDELRQQQMREMAILSSRPQPHQSSNMLAFGMPSSGLVSSIGMPSSRDLYSDSGYASKDHTSRKRNYQSLNGYSAKNS